MIDEHVTYINEILAKRMQKRGNFENEVMSSARDKETQRI